MTKLTEKEIETLKEIVEKLKEINEELEAIDLDWVEEPLDLAHTNIHNATQLINNVIRFA